MRRRVGFFLSNFSAGGAERQYFNLIRGIDKETFDIYVGLIQYRDNCPSPALLESYRSLQGVHVQILNAGIRQIFLLSGKSQDMCG